MPPEEEGGLEKQVKAEETPKEETPKEETPKKGEGTLESIISGFKSIPSLIKKAAHYTYYTAKAGVCLAAGAAIGNLASTLGLAYAAIYGAGMVVGKYISNKLNKTETKFKDIANQFSIGAILGGGISLGFKGIHYVGNAVAAAYGGLAGFGTKVSMGIFNVSPIVRINEYLNRGLISDYKPKESKEVNKQIGTARKYLWPFVTLNLGVFTEVWQNMIIAANNSTIYGYIRGKLEAGKKEEKTPAGALQPGY